MALRTACCAARSSAVGAAATAPARATLAARRWGRAPDPPSAPRSAWSVPGAGSGGWTTAPRGSVGWCAGRLSGLPVGVTPTGSRTVRGRREMISPWRSSMLIRAWIVPGLHPASAASSAWVEGKQKAPSPSSEPCRATTSTSHRCGAAGRRQPRTMRTSPCWQGGAGTMGVEEVPTDRLRRVRI